MIMTDSSSIRSLAAHLNPTFLNQIFQENLLYNAIIRRNLITTGFEEIICAAVAVTTKAELTAFSKLIKVILKLIKICMNEGEWDLVATGLDTLGRIGCCDQPFINSNLKAIGQFANSVLSSNLAEDVAVKGATKLLTVLVSEKPKFFAKEELVIPTLKNLFDHIGNEDTVILGGVLDIPGLPAEELPGITNEIRNSLEKQRLFHILVSTMSFSLPPKSVAEPLMNLIQNYLVSPDAKKRKAACIVAGMSMEGCVDLFFENLPHLLPVLINCMLEDSDLKTRECASYCLEQCSETLKPMILNYADILLPAFIEVMNQNPVFQLTTTNFFDKYLEFLDYRTLQPYVPSLLSETLKLFDQSSSTFAKGRGLTTLSSLLIGAGTEILPWYDQIKELLKTLLLNQGTGTIITRSHSLDTLSNLLFILEPEKFDEEAYQLGMKAAEENFSSSALALKESAFVFYANIAKLLKKKFAHELPRLIPMIFQVLEDDEFQYWGGNAQFLNEEDDNNEDEVIEGGNAVENVIIDNPVPVVPQQSEVDIEKDMNAFINLKKMAVYLLYELALHTEEEFAPYLDRSFRLLSEDQGRMTINSFFQDVRKESLSLFYSISYAMFAKYNLLDLVKTEDKKPAEIPEYVGAFMSMILDMLLEFLSTETNGMIVAKAWTTVDDICHDFGRAVFQIRLKECYDLVLVYLNKLAPCQQARDEGDIDEDNEEDNSNENEDEEGNEDDNHAEDFQEQIFGSFGEYITTMAKYLRDDFNPYFLNIDPILIKYTKTTASKRSQAFALSVYDRIIEYMSFQYTKKCIPQLFPLIEIGLQGDYPILRQNCAFCLAMIVDHSNNEYSSRYPEFLNWLEMLISLATEDVHGADVDNAIATVARIISKTSDKNITNELVVKVISSLPLTEDHGEGPVIYQMLFELLQKNHFVVKDLLSSMIQVFLDALHSKSLAIEKSRKICIDALKYILHHQNEKLYSNGKLIIENYLLSLEKDNLEKENNILLLRKQLDMDK